MAKLRVVLSLLVAVFLSSCGTSSGPAIPAKTHAPILGSRLGYFIEENQYKVLSDIEVNSLKVRVVSISDEICKDGRSERVQISGPIGPDSSEVVERVLQKLERCNMVDGKGFYSPRVYINSSGGLLKDGYKLGQIFRQFQAQVNVIDDQVCASSCAIAFLGGKYRKMKGDAKLIFHAPYIPYAYASIECASKSESQEMRGYFVNFLGQKNGDYLFDRTMSFCSKSDGWALNADAAKLFGLTTE